VDEFEAFRQAKTKVGTMDLKIASIALGNNATLLALNSCDFERIPGLHVEGWLS
jgi:tRNA(fMet)-specific endonuclease VapC